MTLSFGMIVVFLSGANFERISLLGSSVNVERPYVIIGAIWALFVWFLWQYHIQGVRFRREFTRESSRVFYGGAWLAGKIRGSISSYEQRPPIRIADPTQIKVSYERLRVKVWAANFLASEQATGRGLLQEVYVPRIAFKWEKMKSSLTVAYGSPEFSSVVFPEFLALAALCVGQLALHNVI